MASAEGVKYRRTFSAFLCRDFAISISSEAPCSPRWVREECRYSCRSQPVPAAGPCLAPHSGPGRGPESPREIRDVRGQRLTCSVWLDDTVGPGKVLSAREVCPNTGLARLSYGLIDAQRGIDVVRWAGSPSRVRAYGRGGELLIYFRSIGRSRRI